MVVVAGEQLLLVETAGAGLAVHLVPPAPDADARPAVPATWFRPGTPGYAAGIESYGRGELESARWSTRTLCGREWMAMAAGDSGPLYRDQPAQYAPTCRRCLAIVDRRFPPPTPDGRIGLVAELAARAVEEHGSAEIIGVPGEQTTPLRAELPSVQEPLRLRRPNGAHERRLAGHLRPGNRPGSEHPPPTSSRSARPALWCRACRRLRLAHLLARLEQLSTFVSRLWFRPCAVSRRQSSAASESSRATSTALVGTASTIAATKLSDPAA